LDCTRGFPSQRQYATLKKSPTRASRCVGATEVKGFPHPTRTILVTTLGQTAALAYVRTDLRCSGLLFMLG
jgi:hypothetical protein